MPIFGGYETVAELHRGALGAVWSARRIGSTDEPVFAVRTCTPDVALLGEARAAAAVQAFLERARAQQRAGRAAPLAESRWAQVYEIGEPAPGAGAAASGGSTGPDSVVFMVTDLATRGTIERFVAARAQLDARTLAGLVEGIVAGLKQIGTSKGGARPHGRLSASNVLLLSGTPGQPLSPKAASRPPRVALADPAPEAELDADRSFDDDLQAIGRIIHLLVLHEPFRGQLPLEPGPAWDRLGKAGAAWRELTEQLLDPAGGQSRPHLDELAERIGGLRRMRRARTPLVVGIAALALVGGGVGIYFVAEKIRQRAAIPLPETLWNEAAAAQWRELCIAYRTWYGPLLTRLDQRPPASVEGHRTRRAWYAATDAELGRLLEPHALSRVKGSDPWSLAGVESGADLTTLGSIPTQRARSDASVERTRAMLETIGALGAALTEQWPAAAKVRELADSWRQRGWTRPASFAAQLVNACSPVAPTASGTPSEAQPGDVAAAIDDLIRTRPTLERIESKWKGLNEASGELAAFNDPVVKGFPAALQEMFAAEKPAEGAAEAPGTRQDLAAIEKTLDAAADLASRMRTFIREDWEKTDLDSFRSSDRYARLVAGPRTRTAMEDWLFEARGHARLDPALDPRNAAGGWDESALLAGIDRAAATLAAPPINEPIDPTEATRIANVRTAAASVAPARLEWNRRNRDRIETEAAKIRRDVAALQSLLDSRVAARREALATTAEQVREALRARTVISAESDSINAAWLRGRDALLARFAALEFNELREAVKALEAELAFAMQAFGPGDPGDDLGGRISRPAGARPSPWSVRVGALAAAQREAALAQALAGAGTPGEPGFRPAIERAGAAFDAVLDAWATSVSRLETVQRRLDLGDPLIDDGGGASGRLREAIAICDELTRAAPGAAESLSELRQRLDALAQINTEGDSAALVARIRDARPDRPEAAIAAWERLGSAELAWPRNVQDLAAGAAVRDSLARVAQSLPDPARAAELAETLASQLAARWITFALAAPDMAAFEALAQSAPDFGVRSESLPGAVRFNFALRTARAALARAGSDDAATREAAAQFIAEVRRIDNLAPEAAARATQLAQLVDGAEPETPAIDPLTLGPGAAGWKGDADESGTLIFTNGNARLEFKRLEINRSGETVPVYIAVSEFSVGQFAQVVAATRRADEVRQAMAPFDPATATWLGPRSWTWNAAGAVVPNSQWLRLDANVTAQRPAYAPGLLRPGDARRVREESGGEPTADHPVQQVSPAAAALVARLAGCRLPTADEWRAARGLLPADVPLSSWNLRDATFAAQRAHVAAMQAQVVNKASFAWPDAGALLPEAPRVPEADRATSHSFDDGILWFAPVNADARHEMRHLLGNVAEFVFDQPDLLDACAPTAAAVNAALARAPDALGAIGGSAISPPEVPPDSRAPVDLLFSTEGFSDVGFRLAFTARGTRPPRESLASKALRVLPPDAFLFPAREGR